jgi:TetR/AcrR family transcriptional regulator, transcriptional repressor for nem operon
VTEGTRSVILRQAEYLIRTRGYAAFSYADLAQGAGITKASVHYHFPTKEDLVTVLVQHYLERFITTLDGILRRHADVGARLRDYALLFLEGFEQGMLPLCGALSAERSALPASMHATIQEFFRLHLEWLTGVLEAGLATGALRAGIAPDRAALLLLSTLEGGTFVGWALQRKDTVLAAFEAAMRDLELSTPAPRTVGA